jgi:hypothetical protein
MKYILHLLCNELRAGRENFKCFCGRNTLIFILEYSVRDNCYNKYYYKHLVYMGNQGNRFTRYLSMISLSFFNDGPSSKGV